MKKEDLEWLERRVSPQCYPTDALLADAHAVATGSYDGGLASAKCAEEQITKEQILAEQRRLAATKGLTVSELYERLGRGEFSGAILESKLSALRFLLGGAP